MTPERIERLGNKLKESRLRLAESFGDFTLPLFRMTYVAQKGLWRMSTNGSCIYFDPDWLQKLGDTSLDFILAHQLMHIKLGHTERPAYFKGDRFHLACDIVANSYLAAFEMNYELLPGIGRIYTKTFYPREDGINLTSVKAFGYVPFDPATLSAGKRRTYMIDSEDFWDRKDDRGESGTIILYSNEENPELPPFQKGPNYKRILIEKETYDPPPAIKYTDSDSDDGRSLEPYPHKAGLLLNENVKSKIESLRNTKTNDGKPSINEDFIERLWQGTYDRKLNWRTLLNSFLRNSTYDYTFTPPDRRFDDTGFFLPDYNITENEVRNVIFMVDTSGSIDDETLSAVYSEIHGALIQFNEAFTGLLAFFDTRVCKAVRFDDIDDLMRITPCGGGGTDYDCIFNFVNTPPYSDTASDIVIITDGHAKFPDKSVAEGLPVLWLLTDTSKVAPFGRCGWIK